MEPYYSDDLATVYLADCREVLPTLGGESIDFIFTDPPYGHNNNNNGDLAHRRDGLSPTMGRKPTNWSNGSTPKRVGC